MDIYLKVLIVLISYIFILYLIKIFKVGKKISNRNCNNCCPECLEHKNKISPLTRVQKRKSDVLLIILTFNIFDLKRYKCRYCGWTGLRWS